MNNPDPLGELLGRMCTWNAAGWLPTASRAP